MTQGDSGFSLISVNADEDEVVIQAGAPSAYNAEGNISSPEYDNFKGEEQEESGSFSTEYTQTDHASLDDMHDFVEEADEVFISADADEEELQEDDEDVTFESDYDNNENDSEEISAQAGQNKRAPQRYETTLEDLETGSMPHAQKITLAVGVVLVVLAIIYCIVAL